MAPALRMTVSSNPTETQYSSKTNGCIALNQREATNFFVFRFPKYLFYLVTAPSHRSRPRRGTMDFHFASVEPDCFCRHAGNLRASLRAILRVVVDFDEGWYFLLKAQKNGIILFSILNLAVSLKVLPS